MKFAILRRRRTWKKPSETVKLSSAFKVSKDTLFIYFFHRILFILSEKYEYRKFFDKSALVAPKLGPPRPSSLAQVLPASLPQPVPVPRSNAHTTKSHIAASTASTSSYTAPAAPPKHPQLLPTAQPPHPSGGVWNDMNPIKGNSQHLSLPLQYQQDTEKDFASEAYIPVTWPSPHLPVRRETMIRKRKSKSMVHGKEITISGGKLTNVEGDYHEHNTTYVIEEAPTYRGCLETLKGQYYLINFIYIFMIVIVLSKDRVKNLETKVNKLLISSPKEDITKSDDSNRQTMHSPLQKKNESMGDTSSSSHVTEIQFNSLNDPPQSTSVFDDGYCIYQTPSPSRTNDSTPNSRNFSAMAQNGRSLPLGNQLPYPFGYSPIMVPGIAHFFPCW